MERKLIYNKYINALLISKSRLGHGGSQMYDAISTLVEARMDFFEIQRGSGIELRRIAFHAFDGAHMRGEKCMGDGGQSRVGEVLYHQCHSMRLCPAS